MSLYEQTGRGADFKIYVDSQIFGGIDRRAVLEDFLCELEAAVADVKADLAKEPNP